MKLFFDEDTGGSVPRALTAIGIRDIDWVANSRTIKKGTFDELWLPYVGRAGYLLISRNKGILEAEAQRTLLAQERVGAVFLSTGHETRFQILRFILTQWEWLEAIDANEPRPFAYIVTAAGRKRKVTL